MEAAEFTLRPGHRLDRYELLCPIASGGMATVWLARLRGKRGFEKLFAVKTIRTELVGDPRFQEMFLDEARLASGIQHPNVAQILDLGEQEHVLYIVMEWVGGESLDRIRQLVAKRGGLLPIGVTLRVLADASAGLHAAHELRDDKGEPLGIVHRDVSPQNILVSTAGAVKLIDFGIAKAQHRTQGETGIGLVKGKLHYMAPEQVKKERRVDRRTDVWALGVCLYELVTGRLPYGEDDEVEVIRRLMSDEVPASVEGVAPPVQKVLDRALAIEPDTRFPTAAVMQRALEAAMNELGESKTSEDVAAFLRTECPELEQKRKELVSSAMEQAQDRQSGPASRELGLADTLVDEGSASPRSQEIDAPGGRRRMDSDAPAIALTRRKVSVPTPAATALPARPPLSALARSTSASVELDRAPSIAPRRGRVWLGALLVLGVVVVGASLRFPAAARRALHAIGLSREAEEPPPSAPPPPSGFAPPLRIPVVAPSSGPALAPPPASSAGPAGPTAPSPAGPAAATASASARRPASSGKPPEGAPPASAAPSAPYTIRASGSPPPLPLPPPAAPPPSASASPAPPAPPAPPPPLPAPPPQAGDSLH